jgi:nicotinamide mononucleotide transporter
VTGLLDQLRATGAMEWLALLTGVVYVLLAVRHDRRAWLSGAVSSLLLAALAFEQKLPMQAAMQAVYVGFAAYGYRNWTVTSSRQVLPRITTLPLKVHAIALLTIAALSLVAAPGLQPLTQAAWPRLDTAVMLASFFATWMTASSRLENWIYWIVVDLASVALYGAQQLPRAALLYLIYTVIAVLGLRRWWGRWRLQDSGERDLA